MTDTLILSLTSIAVALIAGIPATIAAFNAVRAKEAATAAVGQAEAAKATAAVATETARDTAAEVRHQLTTLTLNVDGRLTQLLDEVRASATLRGREEGAAEERGRQQPSE